MQQIRQAVRVSKPNWWKTACAVFVLCAAMAIGSPAQTFNTLVSFDGTNGENAYYGSLVQGLDGNLYGTTSAGGANGYGTVFKVIPSGTLTTLHSFDGNDGANPHAGLVLATNGKFYGTTGSGGTSTNCYGGCGTVFEITPTGTLTALHSFAGYPIEGANPMAGLVQATDGNFYGTTEAGGANNSCSIGGVTGCGTVFKITPSGTLTTLHSFDVTDGLQPLAGLVQATNGNFYGTTASGGGSSISGTIFKITPAGVLTTLHSFGINKDGKFPYAALVQATDGSFYGTTVEGGTNDTCDGACGTVFKITAGGTLTTLHSFDGTDGEYPYAGLVQATNGNFYGTTSRGGADSSCSIGGVTGCGTVFEITPTGTLTALHSFAGYPTDGANPMAGLVQATDGNFYGTSELGGAYDDGTVFSLAAGLGPFVKTLPTFGTVGAAVKILGTNLTGATSVTFNGVVATFTAVSSSLITTTVPAGATTGTVQVTTPSGTVSSNVPFRVVQ
jgi:uncharacterized repeat protein (TIGR03803 family)